LLLLVVSAGCPARKGVSAPGAPPIPSSGQAGGAPATGDQSGRAEGVLWRASADLDGDGRPEAITLTSQEVKLDAGSRDEDPRINVPVTDCEPAAERCRALLAIGEASQEIGIKAGYFGGIGIVIIDLDTSDGRKELLITQRGESEEDPWYEFSVALYDGSRVHYQELWHSGGYNSGKAAGDGKGTLTLYYDECPDSFAVQYRLQGTQLVEVDRKTVRTSNPDQCAACPHVYLLDGGAAVLQGEILRNLNRAAREGKQSLLLDSDAPATGVVTIELREEKDEVTYLDEIYLDAGGAMVPPRECTGSQAFCATDGVYHLLRRGDTLRLTFPVDAGAAAPLRLFAAGYYLPL
jgi:hypothetical protein